MVNHDDYRPLTDDFSRRIRAPYAGCPKSSRSAAAPTLTAPARGAVTNADQGALLPFFGPLAALWICIREGDELLGFGLGNWLVWGQIHPEGPCGFVRVHPWVVSHGSTPVCPLAPVSRTLRSGYKSAPYSRVSIKMALLSLVLKQPSLARDIVFERLSSTNQAIQQPTFRWLLQAHNSRAQGTLT